MHDLLDGPPEVVHARGEQQARATDSGGPPAARHPVAVEALDEPDGVECDEGRLGAELEEGGEA